MRNHTEFMSASPKRSGARRTRSTCGLLGLLFLLALVPLSCEGDDGRDGRDAPFPPGVGLDVVIDDVRVDRDGFPVVTFRLTDANGDPLSMDEVDDIRWMWGWLEVDANGISRYRSHLLRTATGQPFTYNGMPMQPALATAQQVDRDSGGTYREIEVGTYEYRYGNGLPLGYDQNTTHTMAMYATRDDREYVVNRSADFVPSGAPVTLTRQVVEWASCNDCHTDLAFHGGTRRDIVLCQICHTDQTVDPETGNSQELVELIHKIHTGASLASPYFIIGNRGSVNDYSNVVLPMDVRNCDACHSGGANVNNWFDEPSRVSCGSCHDTIDFSTGVGHNGIIQNDDSQCTSCHPGTQSFEFDLSVPGAHVIPYKSSANPNLTLAITEVSNMMAGMQPTIRFTLSDDSGPVDIQAVDRVAVVFAGNTNDYSSLISNDNVFVIRGGGAIGTLVTNSVGDYTFTPDNYMIPVGATGTWAVGMESRTAAIAVGTENIRFGANNPVAYIDLSNGTLGGGAPLARREVVDQAKCDACHDQIVFHGNLRSELEYCIMCHNTWATDENRRPGVDPVTNPPASIDMKVMIHKIHAGEALENGYQVYGFGSTLHDYSHVVYPGNLAACDTCHVNDSHLLPLPNGRVATVNNIAGVPTSGGAVVLPPTSAACVSCHDDSATLLHTQLNSVVLDPFNTPEACNVCHDEGGAYPVSEAHGGG